ncbi:MAG: T9SS type A sorting domain-containing protein [candidate division WOR-3 bacterium]
MGRFIIVLKMMFLLVFANPYPVFILNEYQTDSTQRLELHITPQTGFPGGNLLNSQIITSGGTSIIDTSLYLTESNYVVIDTLSLSGSYYLPPDTGFIKIYTNFGISDSIRYPNWAPNPPAGGSTSRFYVRLLYDYWYDLFDWYIDYTPTPGFPNDDYSGCKVGGVVSSGGIPLSNACVTARCWRAYMGSPLPILSSTYTSSDGSYLIDSLLPDRYWIKVTALGYLPDSQLTWWLGSLNTTIVNFDLLVGIDENGKIENNGRFNLSVHPNPFRNTTSIVLKLADHFYFGKSGLAINIFDVKGCLVKAFPEVKGQSSLVDFRWHGDDWRGRELAPGVYFCTIRAKDFTKTIKVIKLE